jgi:hypothetical protein
MNARSVRLIECTYGKRGSPFGPSALFAEHVWHHRDTSLSSPHQLTVHPEYVTTTTTNNMADEEKEKADKVAAAKKRVGISQTTWNARGSDHRPYTA